MFQKYKNIGKYVVYISNDNNTIDMILKSDFSDEIHHFNNLDTREVNQILAGLEIMNNKSNRAL
jgi:hypothetical protein